jgi:DUF2945 family protein
MGVLLTAGLVSTILGTASGARNVGINAAIAVGGYIGVSWTLNVEWPTPCVDSAIIYGGSSIADVISQNCAEAPPMPARRFKRGDHVSWNSEAGRARGRISRVVTSAIKFKGYTVRASKDEPQYEIKSDKTDHVAMHKGSALRKLKP